jgi:four helix bundle protein
VTAFDHERLDVYQVALSFAASANTIANDVAVARTGLADQLRRAASSVCLNIAEGAGEFSPKEKARFYRIAKRSTTECSSILDVVKAWTPEVSLEDDLRSRLVDARNTLLRVVGMLIRLVKRVDEAGR